MDPVGAENMKKQLPEAMLVPAAWHRIRPQGDDS
jgi:hypothetical protein